MAFGVDQVSESVRREVKSPGRPGAQQVQRSLSSGGSGAKQSQRQLSSGRSGVQQAPRSSSSSGIQKSPLCEKDRPSSGDSAEVRRAGEMIAGIKAPKRDRDQPQIPTQEERQLLEKQRTALVDTLRKTPAFNPAEDSNSFHGRAFGGVPLAQPRVVWKSNKKPREGSASWLTATEYEDTPEVLKEKVSLLATMLRSSHRTLAYTGAGLSVAAGIGMAAVGSSAGSKSVSTDAEPTLSHYVMAELNRRGLLHGWVQQNHDGLPQKAGYRQEDINEVHGSWFDPSNPVVKYSGSLRHDLFEDLEQQADKADLCLVLGTSLTGLNADQCVTNTASRSGRGDSLGSVIISPQRTSQDGEASLRIFAKADEVMKALVAACGFGVRAIGRGPGLKRDMFPKASKLVVPYDKDGLRSTTVTTTWDLSVGQKIRVGTHNNIQGAKQPQHQHITNSTVGTLISRDNYSICVGLAGTSMKMGLWFLGAAERGAIERLPIINVNSREMAA